jgi:Domain of unknown function (DUF4405)
MTSPAREIELWLDTLLLVLFLLLLAPRLTGLPAHEWLGIVVGIPLLVHLLFSWAWISTGTKRLLTKAPLRSRINYGINAVLFVLTTAVIVSGMAISQVAFPFLGITTINDRSWRALHNLTLNWLLLALGLHVAINWEWIVAALRRLIAPQRSSPAVPNRDSGRLVRTLRRTAVVLIAATVVGVAAFLTLGPPTVTRIYRQNEVARFAGSPARGVGQFAGESMLLCVVAYAGRRWLRVRL